MKTLKKLILALLLVSMLFGGTSVLAEEAQNEGSDEVAVETEEPVYEPMGGGKPPVGTPIGG